VRLLDEVAGGKLFPSASPLVQNELRLWQDISTYLRFTLVHEGAWPSTLHACLLKFLLGQELGVDELPSLDTVYSEIASDEVALLEHFQDAGVNVQEFLASLPPDANAATRTTTLAAAFANHTFYHKRGPSLLHMRAGFNQDRLGDGTVSFLTERYISEKYYRPCSSADDFLLYLDHGFCPEASLVLKGSFVQYIHRLPTSRLPELVAYICGSPTAPPHTNMKVWYKVAAPSYSDTAPT
jgi:hypothetical protein